MKSKYKRKDTPDLNADRLSELGWEAVDVKYEYMLRAMLNIIESEMTRLYWNQNQKEIISPFSNSGELFQNEYVTIRAYNWDENELPNFDTDQLKIFWYKHSNRGVYALLMPNGNVDEILVNVLNNTIQSLKETYNEGSYL